MSTAEILRTLRAKREQRHRHDPKIVAPPAAVPEVFDLARPAVRDDVVEIMEESIALRLERPVLAIRDDKVDLTFKKQEDSTLWKDRLGKAAAQITKAARAIGRIELRGHPQLTWAATGWLVDDDKIVTNRHVAELFTQHDGKGFTFQVGLGAAVDFRQEHGSEKTAVFELQKVLHVEERPGPDLAFFEVEVKSDPKLAQHITLAKAPRITPDAAVIGYPARDGRIPEPALMEDIFGDVYNKKRLSPGGVIRLEDSRIHHDCTTLGGNSGSAIIDLDSGEALGLHFSGTFLVANYAVPASVVAERLADLKSGRIMVSVPERRERPAPQARTATVTVPLTITVSVGAPGVAPVVRAFPQPPARARAREEEVTEAPAKSYEDRGGYDPEFLGVSVPLPVVVADADDVLRFTDRGKAGEHELRYQHFSVVMSKRRRLCFFSAANINGELSKKAKRTGWRLDGRIPTAQQIKGECYGDPPKKFSRGHMTRREDPVWGTPTQASLGNDDSMHVTNATPQMQAFNSPIWLELEDYVLANARTDGMRVSVFTGPYFDDKRDPEIDGVLIPRAFWKIIAFIHDKTKKVVATGYEMAQDENLPAEEFIYGQFVSSHQNIATQVPIRSIEMRSGINFHGLAARDPYVVEEAIGASRPLLSLDDIQIDP